VTTALSVDVENIIEEGQQEKINRFLFLYILYFSFIAMTEFVTIMCIYCCKI